MSLNPFRSLVHVRKSLQYSSRRPAQNTSVNHTKFCSSRPSSSSTSSSTYLFRPNKCYSKSVKRQYFSSRNLFSDAENNKIDENTNQQSYSAPLGNINDITDSRDRMLALAFTCNICNTRSARQFSHHSYTKGIVIIQCPGCSKYHLIADNLGWFQEGQNIEEIMAKKGETIQKITNPKDMTPEVMQLVEQAVKAREESHARRMEYRAQRDQQRIEESEEEDAIAEAMRLAADEKERLWAQRDSSLDEKK